jgi:biopolymer transport protein ExbD
MKFTIRSRDEVDINLTPLIDVVFLLLIFFMVTTTFKSQADLKVTLPTASAKSESQPETPIELGIDASGRYYLAGKALANSQADTLFVALAERLRTHEKAPLIVRADARTPHQFVVTAMDTAARLGLSRLSIATTTTPTAP